MLPHHIIIGASAAGIGALRALMRLAPHDTITCITDQDELPYNTCFLADYCAGTMTQEQLFLLHDRALPDHVKLLRNTRVTRIMPASRQIVCADGTVLSYTTLLIATGTSAFIPPIEGLYHTQGVFSFARLSDVNAILAYLHQRAARTAVVIGAGLSGLEVADALAARGLRVQLIERAPHVLKGVIDSQAAACIERYAYKAGVSIMCNATVARIEHDKNGRVRSVVLATGQEIAADMVISAVGSRPNLAILKGTEIAYADNAIITDAYMRTSQPHIYAAGDIALTHNALTGLSVRTFTWPDAMAQGLIAAHAMAGNPRTYGGIVPYVSSSFFGCKFAACGQYRQEVGLVRKVIAQEDGYQCFVENSAGVLRGFVVVGQGIGQVAELKRIVMTG